MKVNITPKDKKLLKSSKVRKFFKAMEVLMNEHLAEQDVAGKVAESIALGVPLKMYDDGRIELVKDLRNKGKVER